jgi:phosphatidylglycerol:prolipoprotein diacylglycerol transferase
MKPEIEVFGIAIKTFGVCFALGFLACGAVVHRRLRELGRSPDWAYEIVGAALFGGVVGARVYYLAENYSQVKHDLLGSIFSGSGLVWYGGAIGGAIAVVAWMAWRHVLELKILDMCGTALALGYAIGRIGCQVSGDGDYGMPTSLPWGAVYSNGTYPPSVAFREFPEIVARYGVDGVVPDSIPVHPTPVYEFIIGLVLFFVLWKMRTASSGRDGTLFMWYLVLAGTARFLVEFIRLNPRLLFGLSEAQLISALMIAIGLIGLRGLARSKEKLG